MYYKAELFLTTESMDENDEGINPDSYRDHGLIDTITAPTLALLKKQIESRYFNLDNPIGADIQIDTVNNAISICYEGEPDYRTPAAEQVPFYETVAIYISCVEESRLNLSEEPLFAKVASYK